MSDCSGCVEKVDMFTALRKYATFSGRARRTEYWLWVLFTFIVSFGLSLLVRMLGDSAAALVVAIVYLFVQLAFFIPGLAVFCRRMHDTGRSGWNILWMLLPIVGGIIILILTCLDSQPGENQYGPNPKGL